MKHVPPGSLAQRLFSTPKRGTSVGVDPAIIYSRDMPLLPRLILILGMPLILIVPVVRMSQITSTQILGLTKPNYNAPRISPSR